MLPYVIIKIHRLLHQSNSSKSKVSRDSHLTDEGLMTSPRKKYRPLEVLADGERNLERLVEKKDDEY